MIERFLIEHCSATLASIKAANLCNMTFSSKEELEDQISYWSACLEPKGIRIFVLREHETRALVYVYREGLLQKELENPENAAFLKSYGYENTDIAYALNRLKTRVAECKEGFPHEIGVFLNYPLGDVIGFIENKGHNARDAGRSIAMSAKHRKHFSAIRNAETCICVSGSREEAFYSSP